MIIGRQIRIRGLVQGVGFRPTVWRLAHQHSLTGQVLNDGQGVLIDAWARETDFVDFLHDLKIQCPPLARIDSIEQSELQTNAARDFRIVTSHHNKIRTGIVADAKTCQSCFADVMDENNRRYRYPFTNCTHCGPRLSIIDGIPYDRAKTSMAPFVLCKNCQFEYDNPADRRFHAQPNACPDCGPKVWLEPEIENVSAIDDVEQAALLLKQGKIVAIKGIGGFHLACKATDTRIVNILRNRKYRYGKPFALMARDMDIIESYCNVSAFEKELLSSTEAPIVLLEAKQNTDLSPAIAPELKILGFMLPYTPLHHLLMLSIDFPVVMTSGNISDVPQCIDNDDAVRQLQTIADFLLLNDRAIRNRVDDSVARVVADKTLLLRRARGYAPATITLPAGFEKAVDVLAFGGELKNTFCMVKDGQAILSQHMGDLENTHTFIDYQKNLQLYKLLFNHTPSVLAIDSHPEYLSSKEGLQQGEFDEIPVIKVQHHHAHITACLAENNWPLKAGKVLGIVLDGLGFGDDGTIWGGEFLLADYYGFQRLGCLKPVPLPGASQAMREPWRNTFSHLMSIMNWQELVDSFDDLDLVTYLGQKPVATLNTMLAKGINSPLASSCGRLFDAVAAATGLCRDQQLYEGQAAMKLEACVSDTLLSNEKNKAYPFTIETNTENLLPYLDSKAMWQKLLLDLQQNTATEIIASRFHLGLAKGIVDMVDYLCNETRIETGQPTINTLAISGGVFQNRVLFELLLEPLQMAGYKVLHHSEIPANDGGISLGQATIAMATMLKN